MMNLHRGLEKSSSWCNIGCIIVIIISIIIIVWYKGELEYAVQIFLHLLRGGTKLSCLLDQLNTKAYFLYKN